MADKPIHLVNGRLRQVEATVNSGGAVNAGDVVALDASGRLDITVMPAGFGDDAVAIIASENLAAGSLVNVWDDAGTPKARKADATAAGKETNGFVLEAFNADELATVFFVGSITGLSGMVPGTRYYTSTTAGTVTAIPPSAPGNVVQYIGIAISTAAISYEATDGVILA